MTYKGDDISGNTQKGLRIGGGRSINRYTRGEEADSVHNLVDCPGHFVTFGLTLRLPSV
jgi:hypothetical protein